VASPWAGRCRRWSPVACSKMIPTRHCRREGACRLSHAIRYTYCAPVTCKKTPDRPPVICKHNNCSPVACRKMTTGSLWGPEARKPSCVVPPLRPPAAPELAVAPVPFPLASLLGSAALWCNPPVDWGRRSCALSPVGCTLRAVLLPWLLGEPVGHRCGSSNTRGRKQQ